MNRSYDYEFFQNVRSTSVPSAEAITPFLLKMLNPRSVVDVGCGEGAWLSVFAQNKVERILGIDGNYVNEERLLIPRACFLARDLAQPFTVDEPFDLAVSLEVAEHLPKSSAKSFVSSLTSAAPVTLFSAAIPGQGGMDHINEQWPSYWASLFAECDFDCFDILRQSFWNESRIAWWYRQNVLLFSRRGSNAWLLLSKLSEPKVPAALIHPELWSATQDTLIHWKALGSDPGLRLSLVHMVRAIRRRLSIKR